VRMMPGLQDPFPGDPQGTWQRRANPVLIALLHLVLESRATAQRVFGVALFSGLASFVLLIMGLAVILFMASHFQLG
jgi:hypothetical protein